MDDVECESASTNFLSCSSSAEDCSHLENVFLTCNASGETIFQGAVVDSNEMS